MTQDPLFSEHWYQVRDLRPRLAGDVIVRRHVYRNLPSYVIHRPSTGVYHRVDARVFEVIAGLDGTVSVDELWQRAIAKQAEHAPTQPELMRFLAQLHEAELLTVNRKLDAEQLFSRSSEMSRRETRQRYLNPLFLRFTLFDPDRLLDALIPLTRWVFSRTALFAWFVLIALGLTEVLPNWNKLQLEIASYDFFSAESTILFVLFYPILKLVHELAHGLAVKRFGGEVHEFGLALMVLLPVPYVDASAAAAFPDKTQRILVSAAGILVEAGVAAVAALVWGASQGPVHDAMLMLMLVGGVSTVLFNGNPLLKFDGYYVLADAVEIPNLADRSRNYLLGVARGGLFGLRDQRVEPVDGGERIWLIAYGLLSGTYRIALMLAIAMMLSDKFFFFGVALALWVLLTLICLPICRVLRFLVTEPGLSRPRAVLVTAGVTAFVLIGVIWLPVPFNTVARGVVWLPENAIVRVQRECEVTRTLVEPGSTVAPGMPLFDCEDYELAIERDVLRAQLDELIADVAGLDLTDRLKHETLSHEMATLEARLRRTDEQIRMQRVTAQSTGRFLPTDEKVLDGRFIEPEDTVGYVVPDAARTVRVAFEQADAAGLELESSRVELRLVGQADRRLLHDSSVQRQTPKSTLRVPSAALTTAGGGQIAADPEGDGRTVLNPVFDVELTWPVDAPLVNVGTHVMVKFLHEPQPLIRRLMIGVQRAFLGRLVT